MHKFKKHILGLGLIIFFLSIIHFNLIPAKAESRLYGEGSREIPYEINTPEDLIILQQEVNSGNTFAGCYIIQKHNIDFSMLEEYNFNPIGNIANGTYFAGIYNGNGHYISNLKITSNEDAALFGAVAGTIENLGIESGSILSPNYSAGIAVHAVGNTALIINCYNKAEIHGSKAGGITVAFNGHIINCWNTGKCITPSSSKGKITESSYGQMLYVYSTDEIYGEEYYGQDDYSETISSNTNWEDLSKKLNSNLNNCVRFGLIPYEDAIFWNVSDQLCFNIDANDNNILKTTHKNKEEGTKKSPITIASLEDLIFFRFAVDYGITYSGTYFLQTNDIDASSILWEPIGSVSEQKIFSGYYNGNGKKIENLNVQKEYSSLFECLSGSVYNLYVANSAMQGKYVGGITYTAYGYPKIYNCCVTGTFSPHYLGGGIACELGNGEIMNCWTIIESEKSMYGICAGSSNMVKDCFSNINPLLKPDIIGQNIYEVSPKDIESMAFTELLNNNLISNINIPLENIIPWKYNAENNEIAYRNCQFPLLFLCFIWVKFHQKTALIILIILFGIIYTFYRKSKIYKKTNKENNIRNGFIDTLRILFCFCIMLLHWGQFVGDTSLYAPCGYIGVSFFFMVSGYYLTKKITLEEIKSEKSKDLASETRLYVLKKWSKIFPYFLVAAIISIIMVSIFSGARGTQLKNNLQLYIFEVLMLQMAGFPTYAIMGTEWYLSALFLTLLFLYPIIRNNRKMYTHIAAPLLFIFLTGYSAHQYGNFTSTASWTGLCYEGILRAIACLSAGSVCYEISTFISICRNWTKCGKSILTIVELGIWARVFYSIFTEKSFSYNDFIITLLIFCGLCLTFSEVSYSKTIFNGYCTTIAAQMSIPLFLCHGYLLIFLPRLLENCNKYISVAIFLICALITSLVDFLIVECIKRIYKSTY